MCGRNRRGSASRSFTRHRRRSSTTMCIGRPQCAHSVEISTSRRSFLRRPSTKDVAKASSAQAPKIRSPVLNRSRCGVRSEVTGKAQLTSPRAFRTRKNKCFSRSSSRLSDNRGIQPERARNQRGTQRRAVAGQFLNYEISHRMVMRRHESQTIAHAIIVPWYIDTTTCRSLSSHAG